MKVRTLIVLFAAVLMFGAEAAQAQDVARNSLAGISRIQIVIEDLDEDGEKIISKSEILRIIENKFRANGIGITADSGRADRYNYIYVNVNALTLSTVIVFNVQVSFNQGVTLMNGEGSRGATWERSTIASASFPNARNQGRNVVDRLIGQFVDDFLAVN